MALIALMEQLVPADSSQHLSRRWNSAERGFAALEAVVTGLPANINPVRSTCSKRCSRDGIDQRPKYGARGDASPQSRCSQGEWSGLTVPDA